MAFARSIWLAREAASLLFLLCIFVHTDLRVGALTVPINLVGQLQSGRTSGANTNLRVASDPVSVAASQSQGQHRLAVSIDEPLVVFDRMSPVASRQPGLESATVPFLDVGWPAIKRAIAGLFASKSFRLSLKVTIVASCLFMAFFHVSKSFKKDPKVISQNDSLEVAPPRKLTASVWSILIAVGVATSKRLQALRERFQRQPELAGVPMPFDKASGNEGWSVCTLRSKRRLGRSSFLQYEFDLPRVDYVLPLDLGQQVSLCCLDNSNNVAKGEFFTYNAEMKKRLGRFAILAPNRTPAENEFAIGDDAANFIRVLKEDLKVGDEIALKPGKNRLAYRGQYLPVTDMVYVACGTGIAPVMDQVRMVLPPTSSSSVESVTVVWINESTRDFDVNAEQLEKEYHKFNTKLAVACIVEDLTKGESVMSQNTEIFEAVPDFIPGTMAVLSGPGPLMETSVQYLQGRGYPMDCMCLL